MFHFVQIDTLTGPSSDCIPLYNPYGVFYLQNYVS